jgi:hypothetical protein
MIQLIYYLNKCVRQRNPLWQKTYKKLTIRSETLAL